MEEKSKTPLIIISILIVIVTISAVIGIIALKPSDLVENPNSTGDIKVAVDQNGVQVIDITAKGGYKPNQMKASANKPILLKVATNGTYDCSSSIYIPKLNINKNLPSTGTTNIEIPAQKAGTNLDITCSMGMYRAKLTIT